MSYKDKEKQLKCQREWYKRNKVKRRTQVTERRRKITEWFKQYKKTKSCIKCGESCTICLDFHHREKKNIEITKMANSGYSLESIKKEIEKCDVLCANCHRKEHYLNFKKAP